MAYAHDRKILHRDIKPANVLLTAEASPKLADFNISYGADVEGSSARAFFGGSVAYMSLEQLEAYNHTRQPEDLDGRSDIYSLAVMLWELLTGTRPFGDEFLPQGWEATLQAMISRRAGGLPDAVHERIAQTQDTCARALQEVLAKCLEPEPDNRYAGAEEVARQLELCLEPRVQELLRPAAGSYVHVAVRHPFLTWLAAALAPNILLSVLNIFYNLAAIIKNTNVLAEDLFWSTQLAVINGVAYSAGIFACYRVAKPLLHGLRRIRDGKQIPLEDRAPWPAAA